MNDNDAQQKQCPECRGTGLSPFVAPDDWCLTCHGEGWVWDRCPVCFGRGGSAYGDADADGLCRGCGD